ncbi:hypothetical protein E3N88_22416 [Mikania micrantha]|uniref:Uncharacterized protein n=1 Tax=Mikania micrantha TaxID=192012 RepID=A0A5N6ND24_9ASTR|nr:hypothetical protein E3N88_22416 [Mikania micrantha]
MDEDVPGIDAKLWKMLEWQRKQLWRPVESWGVEKNKGRHYLDPNKKNILKGKSFGWGKEFGRTNVKYG